MVCAESVEERGAEAEAGGVAEGRRVLFEGRRDGIVIEPEEEESDGDASEGGELGEVVKIGVSGSEGWNISSLSEP